MTLLPWLICILRCTQYTWNWSRRRCRFMYLVVSEFDILPKSLGGKSNCNLYFVSVFGTLSYGMASFMRPIWLKSNLCNAIPTTCLVTIEIQRGCCQKGHLKMIHIYQCLFVPYSDFPYFWFWKLIWYNKQTDYLNCIAS